MDGTSRAAKAKASTATTESEKIEIAKEVIGSLGGVQDAGPAAGDCDDVKALIGPDGDLTARFATVLADIFVRFDADADGTLNTLEMQAYARACNAGREFEDEELDEIRTYFQVDDAGSLTKPGFLQMYHLQSGSEAAETWKDLTQLGYGPDLTLTAAESPTAESPVVPNAIAPAWTRGEFEPPAGEKEMGGSIAGVCTAARQARLGVDPATSPAASTATNTAASPAADSATAGTTVDTTAGAGVKAASATPPVAYTTYADDAAIGTMAPPIDTVEYVQGGPVQLGGGKVTVVSFFAKFAKGDYTTIVGLNALAVAYPDVGFVGVSIDPDRADAEGFLKKLGTAMPEIYIDSLDVSYPLAWDNGKAVKEAYRKAAGLLSLGASAVFVVDRTGTIVWREQFGQGHAPHQGQLSQQIRRTVAGEPLLSNGPTPAMDEGEENEEELDMGGADDYDSDLGF